MNEQSKKNILIFSTTYSPFIGGAEVAIKEITDRIDHYFFDMITPRFDRKLSKQEKIGNINVYRVGFGFKFDKYFLPLIGLIKAIKLHKKNNYEIVWGMMANYAGLAAFLFQGIFSKVKYLLTLQSGDSELFMWLRTWFWYPLYRLVYTQADYIQSISHYLKIRAQKHGFEGRIEVVPNGVDIKSFDQEFSEAELLKLRSELGFSKDDFVLVTTSRLVKKNGIEDVIKSLSKLSDSVKFLIIGNGKLENELKTLTEKLNLQTRVKFLGFIDHPDMIQYLHLADAFIRPSLSEGLGNSFLEAMACKLPIIATEVGGIKDFLQDHVTGIVCKPQDPASIARAVQELVADKELYNSIVTNGFAMVIREYDWELVAEKMKKIFEQI